jgi:hypothetical protein
MRIRAQLCRFAIAAEMPEWNEIECPIDFNSAETGKVPSPITFSCERRTPIKIGAVRMPFPVE